MRLCALIGCLAIALSAFAQEPAQVLISDRGLQNRTIGPGAPPHTIGLKGIDHQISMDTGVTQYGLRYVVALDPKDPAAAIPGEGYIGMLSPSACNWYHGGFFDLSINGQSIGNAYVHSFTGRSLGDRGCIDYVFDTPQAVVRVRFVGKANDNALYCQALLEPKQEVTALHLMVRCYPSAFVSNADRHVMAPARDLKQGEKAELDLAQEWWLMYYDSIFDAGHVAPNATGVGPCAVLFPGGQAAKAGFTVGGYGIDTNFELKPVLRDFRFVFFDFAGTKNADAEAALRQRAPGLLQELATFEFTDPSLTTWDLAAKQEEVKQALALVPDDKAAAERYAQWGKQLEEQLKLVKQSGPGAIMSEATAAKTIGEWERGLPELKLQALLNEI